MSPAPTTRRHASNPDIATLERADRAGVPIVEKPLLGNALIEAVREALHAR
jgi:hypothetical protein